MTSDSQFHYYRRRQRDRERERKMNAFLFQLARTHSNPMSFEDWVNRLKRKSFIVFKLQYINSNGKSHLFSMVSSSINHYLLLGKWCEMKKWLCTLHADVMRRFILHLSKQMTSFSVSMIHNLIWLSCHTSITTTATTTQKIRQFHFFDFSSKVHSFNWSDW